MVFRVRPRPRPVANGWPLKCRGQQGSAKVSVSPSVDGSDDRQRTDLTTDACATLSVPSVILLSRLLLLRAAFFQGGRLARLAAICERVFSGGGMIFPDRQHRQIYDPRKRTDKMLYSLRMPDDLVIFVRLQQCDREASIRFGRGWTNCRWIGNKHADAPSSSHHV